MSFAKCSTKAKASEGRRFRLNVVGLTDRRIFVTVLGDDAQEVQDFIEQCNKAHFEENGLVERTADQVADFLTARFALQVRKVETEFTDKTMPHRAEVEVTDGEWLPAGLELAKRLWEEDMRFVYEPIFAYARNRSNFLPGKGGN